MNNISNKDPISNVERNDIYPNYGSTVDNGNAGTDEFGYVEFSGRDGRTCPTCHGTGRISKHQEDELVALIPYNDQRLKPSKTKRYVILAVSLSLIASALVLFFLFPRTVTIKQDGIIKQNVTINQNTSATAITLWNRFNLSNTNYFSVEVTSIVVQAFFDRILVGVSKLPKTPTLRIGARNFNSPIVMKIVAEFGSGLEYVKDLCTNPKRKVHDIVISMQLSVHASSPTLAYGSNIAWMHLKYEK